MAKRALLIGVSDYGEGLPPLTATPNDVAALQQVLADPQMAGFDSVTPLLNPDFIVMQRAIQSLFSGCVRDDLLLLYFSGHGITDDSNHLYLANRTTAQADFEATAVPARFIQQQSLKCYTRRQVIILDCCYSGAFAQGWQAKAAGLNLQQDLGAEGRVVLTSSTATQTSFQPSEGELSLYTQYLVEGIATGAADHNQDGNIYVHELHSYAKQKVQEAKPSMQPDILMDREGYNILISKAPLPQRDPKLDFRRLVEAAVRDGEISPYRRETLHHQAQGLGLATEPANAIIASVLEPFRLRKANLTQFRDALAQEVSRQYPLDPDLLQDVEEWAQQVLGLTPEDVEAAKQTVLAPAETHRQAQLRQQAIERQRQEATARQQQAERQRQETAAQQQAQQQQRQQPLRPPPQPAPLPQPQVNKTRRQTLQWLGYGSLALGGATAVSQWQRITDKPSTVPEPTSTPEPTPTSTPNVAVEPTPTPSAPVAPGDLKAIEFTSAKVDDQGKVIERPMGQAQVWVESKLSLPDWAIPLEMALIPAGEFMMGSPDNELDRRGNESPQHRVQVPEFMIGRYAITQAQYQAVIGKNPSHFTENGGNRPMESVSWNDAVAFCEKLSQMTGREYRLPSEAEWEYACRAGTTTPFYFGATITPALANYNGNYPYGNGSKGEYRQQTTPVGQFAPNGFGLYDMHGNVWEWCQDVWHDNYQGAPVDGSAWTQGGNQGRRILRGGSWYSRPRGCRSAYRNDDTPDDRDDVIGFRVCCSAPRTLG